MSDGVRRRDGSVGPIYHHRKLEVSKETNEERTEDRSSPRNIVPLVVDDEAVLRRSNHQAVGDGSTSDSGGVGEGELVDVRVVVVLLDLRESEVRELVSATFEGERRKRSQTERRSATRREAERTRTC